ARPHSIGSAAEPHGKRLHHVPVRISLVEQLRRGGVVVLVARFLQPRRPLRDVVLCLLVGGIPLGLLPRQLVGLRLRVGRLGLGNFLVVLGLGKRVVDLLVPKRGQVVEKLLLLWGQLRRGDVRLRMRRRRRDFLRRRRNQERSLRVCGQVCHWSVQDRRSIGSIGDAATTGGWVVRGHATGPWACVNRARREIVRRS